MKRLVRFAPSGPVILQNLDTTGVTAVGDGLPGFAHAVFAESRSVMNAVKLLLEHAKPSPRLAEIIGVPALPLAPQYWRYAL